MHILYVHQYFSTPDGSTGTRSYEMARRLIARGHEVTMLCAETAGSVTGLAGPFVSGAREGVVHGIRVIELQIPYSNHLNLFQRARSFSRFAVKSSALALRRQYDLVFATSTPLTAAIPGIAAKALRGKPFVFEVRDLWPELPRAMGVVRSPLLLGMMSALEWLAYRSADAAVALAPGIAEGIRRRSRVNLPISLVPNGCDLALFNPAQRGSLALPGVDKDDFVALFTGAHGIANGLDALLDAAHELKKLAETKIKLVFIGDGKVKRELQSRAAREGLDSCIFLPPMAKTELAQVVASAHAGLMVLADVPAFYYGTSPNKFFDYIAAGLPVVTNYPGWLAKLIKEHNCGIPVPPRDPAALAKALINLRDDPEACRRMAAKARALAEHWFSRAALSMSFCSTLEFAAAHAGRAVDAFDESAAAAPDEQF